MLVSRRFTNAIKVKSIKVDDQSGQTLFVTESLNLHAYLYIHAHLYDEKMSRWRGMIQGITLLGQISRFFILIDFLIFLSGRFILLVKFSIGVLRLVSEDRFMISGSYR